MMQPTPTPAAATRPLRRLVPLALLIAGVAATTAPAIAGPAGAPWAVAPAADHPAAHRAGQAMHGDGRGMGPLLDHIGVTDAQRAQIEQIVRSAREEGQPRRETVMALRGQMAALFAQPSIDAGAVEAVRQQMVALHDEASQQRLQTMLAVAQVLTPEQRAQMAARMQARADKIKARRAAGERRAP